MATARKLHEGLTIVDGLIFWSDGTAEPLRQGNVAAANVTVCGFQSDFLGACDELAGFLTACSYVKPGRSIYEVDVSSVKRKLKDKPFARNVNREDIVNGAQELGVPLEEHIAFSIDAMKQSAPELGLAGTAQTQNA